MDCQISTETKLCFIVLNTQYLKIHFVFLIVFNFLKTFQESTKNCTCSYNDLDYLIQWVFILGLLNFNCSHYLYLFIYISIYSLTAFVVGAYSCNSSGLCNFLFAIVIVIVAVCMYWLVMIFGFVMFQILVCLH